ncbi:MAG: phosphate ABC transporter substrate-binding protein [Firmicutes bacterium]|nr:phosphate ABC transporter substrate-binding protein [Bacillota bacterium]
MNQNRWLTVLGLVLLVSMLFVVGCGGQHTAADTTPDEGGENGSDEALIEAASIMIGGSDSEVNVVTRLAEEFMIANPHVSIAVTGGGSGVGISSLIDGDIDIANSSRPMKDEEMENLKANQGDDAYAVIFAVDGVAVVVNENNPVSELTVDQVGAIYRGEITNWSDLGGDDLPITLNGRQSTSGTYVFFMELVVKADYSPQMRNLPGTSDIVEAVAGDIGGIGYAAIGYADRDGVKALSIAKDTGSQAYDPTVLENVTSGDYPLTRPLYQYITGKPGGALLEFFLFETTEVGQKIVLEEGFYPITEANKEFNKKALQ